MSLEAEKFTLLVVDDEKQNRLLLTEIFHEKYRIIQAKNGQQALNLAKSRQPDLILLDVLMPEMDGLTVIKELKRSNDTRQIPVIFITALDSATDEEQGLLLGAVDYIAKPLNAAIVRVRVENHLKIVHQRRLLESLASLDGLTGIPNRRSFDETYKKESLRCQREAAELSLLVLDVDQFKLYNDALGHAAGDRVLQEVAQVIRSSVSRSSDFVARYGGEEFVVLLPKTEKANALQVAEKILANLKEAAIPHPASSIASHITVSLGGATFVPTANSDLNEIFKQADAALYQAKSLGRNQAVWASL